MAADHLGNIICFSSCSDISMYSAFLRVKSFSPSECLF